MDLFKLIKLPLFLKPLVYLDPCALNIRAYLAFSVVHAAARSVEKAFGACSHGTDASGLLKDALSAGRAPFIIISYPDGIPKEQRIAARNHVFIFIRLCHGPDACAARKDYYRIRLFDLVSLLLHFDLSAYHIAGGGGHIAACYFLPCLTELLCHLLDLFRSAGLTEGCAFAAPHYVYLLVVLEIILYDLKGFLFCNNHWLPP